jgi:hypothetical protein
VLTLLLVWVALSPRGHVIEKAPPLVAQTEAAISPSANHAASTGQNIAKPTEPEIKPAPTPIVQQAPTGDLGAVPELTASDVKLENFDSQSDVASIAQPRLDSDSAVDLKNPDDVSFSLAGLDSPDHGQANTPLTPGANAPEPQQRVSERRHGKQRHSSSPWQSLDRVRGSVQGLLRHIF